MEKEDIKSRFLQMKTRADVASMLGISEKSLRYFLYKVRPENMYTTFDVIKKDGTKRVICAPNKELKAIQRKLATALLAVYSPKRCVFGFVNGRNNVANAERHVKRKVVFNIDLKDFFSQIHFGRVRGMLISKPYSLSEEAATTIAQIACYERRLPQGAPSSPIITNMICAPLDNALMRLAKKTKCVYTRYADDLSFSTFRAEFDKSIVYIENGTVTIGDALQEILDKHSFEVNPKKTILRPRMCRQEVTGLTVNEFPNLRRSYIRQLRAILHSCEKYGVCSAAKVYIEKGLCHNAKICQIAHDPDPDEEVKLFDWFRQVLVGKILYIQQVKGRTSPTFVHFANKANEIFGESVFDSSVLSASPTFENIYQNSVVLLEGEGVSTDGKAIVIQGSGFVISGVGLFTSFHVTEKGEKFDIYSIDRARKKTKLGTIAKSIHEIAADKGIDYALYRFSLPQNEDLTYSFNDSARIAIGEQVTLIGYPDYAEGASQAVIPCCVTEERKFFGAPFYTVGGRVVHGASGGIVLNGNNEAIGIIKGGVATTEGEETNDNQGFVPLCLVYEHLKNAGIFNNIECSEP